MPQLGGNASVWTPPNEEHWHGGTAQYFMSHVAMLEGVEDSDGTNWLEPVTDAQFEAANQNN